MFSFHGIQQIRSPALMANFFYLHGAYNEIRRLTLVCGLISEGNVDGGIVDGRKASGALVLLKVPELLSSASLLISLIIGHSFLRHLCPYSSVNVVEGGCSSEYICKPCKVTSTFCTFTNPLSLKYIVAKYILAGWGWITINTPCYPGIVMFGLLKHIVLLSITFRVMDRNYYNKESHLTRKGTHISYWCYKHSCFNAMPQIIYKSCRKVCKQWQRRGILLTDINIKRFSFFSVS